MGENPTVVVQILQFPYYFCITHGILDSAELHPDNPAAKSSVSPFNQLPLTTGPLGNLCFD